MSTTVMQKVQIIPLRRADRHDLRDQDHSSSGSSASPPEKVPFTKQKGLKKVRTGCVTCKIRRVKCDETKPACNRCTSTGRNCDGYIILPRKKRSRTITSAPTDGTAPESEHIETIERCLSMVKVSPIERSALEFFQMRTAPALSSYFDNEFWNTLVLKISQAEPAIQHALIAVASLHRQREDGGDETSISRLTVASNQSLNAEKRLDWMQAQPSGENDPFALLHYNQAISHLSTKLSAGDSTSIEITLFACILFVCIEFLRGDAQPAIQHYKGGMKIAFDALAKSGHSQSTAERIRNDILPFFHRLELLSMLFGTDGSWDYPVDLMTVLPTELSTMKDARDSLVHLMNLSLRFIRSTNQRRYTNDIVPEDVTQQFSLSQGLQAWQEKLDLLITTKQMTSRDLEAAKILRIHQVVARVWLSCATEEHESSIDAHIPDFETAIRLAESLHAASNTSSTTSTFLFDMEIVSPLYFIAIKCRHPLLRRRAIAILHRMTRREGLWDSNMAAAVAERIVEIEEAKLLMIDETTLPDEVARVHDSHIDQTASLDPSEHGVTFHMRDQGEWVVWRETIVIPEVERVSRRGRAASKVDSVDDDREEMNIFMNGISLEG